MIDSYLLEYLIAATRGGETRIRIIQALKKKSMNMHQVSKTLKIDYKTAQHHLRILADNNILSVVKRGSYGAMYYLSPEMKSQIKLFREITGKN